MLFKSLEKQLGLQDGLVSAVLSRGVKVQYNRFPVSPKRQLIRRQAKISKKRMIFAPTGELKAVQRAIAKLISRKFTAHRIAHAYENGRSIFSNARQHVSSRSILKIDLVNFFGSISQNSVIDAINSSFDDFSDREIKAIAELCCYDGYLPQGSPASPVLSNLVCYPLDVQLDELARLHGCIVTRFSDDTTFSTTARAFPSALARTWKCGLAYRVALEPPILSLLQGHGFSINLGKLKFQARPRLLKITGLIVGDGVSVPREFLHNLRAGLHQWERRGLNACARAYTNDCVIAFTNSLRGSIEYIGQAQGWDCDHYQHALAKFNTLQRRDEKVLSAVRKVKAANVSMLRTGSTFGPLLHASDHHGP